MSQRQWSTQKHNFFLCINRKIVNGKFLGWLCRLPSFLSETLNVTGLEQNFRMDEFRVGSHKSPTFGLRFLVSETNDVKQRSF